MTPRERYMLYALGFGDGAVVRVVRHPDHEDYLRGYADGRAARQAACARFAAEVGHEPTILRAESGGEVFVFGSNLAGRHGRGAALEARRAHGAEPGVGSGPTGRAYAIPTKDERLNSLPLPVIAGHVRAFVAYAESRPSDRFRVTRVGCGLAGYVDADRADVLAPGRVARAHRRARGRRPRARRPPFGRGLVLPGLRGLVGRPGGRGGGRPPLLPGLHVVRRVGS